MLHKATNTQVGETGIKKLGDHFVENMRDVQNNDLRLTFKVYVMQSIRAAETWKLASCDHGMLRYVSKVRWQDKITNEEVRGNLLNQMGSFQQTLNFFQNMQTSRVVKNS